MAEYIDLDTPLEMYRPCGKRYEHISTTLRELLDFNKIPHTAADVQPVRHGRWYRFQKVYIDPQTGMGFARDMYKCNACNVGEEETRKPYCPNCGALMDKEESHGETD